MDNDEIQRYRAFFIESIDGQKYIQKLHEAITRAHEDAEKNPELARDYTQRAKGVRTALETINSLTAGIKKGKSIDK